jgi:hypothetical protein
MESRSTTIRVPEGSRVFVFGSVINLDNPRDVDVLVVYDPDICQPALAYRQHLDLRVSLESLLDVPVHITLLTEAEEAETGLVRLAKAIELAAFLRTRIVT